MPIFRYTCKKCNAEFELLLPRFDSEAKCPKCGSLELEKALNRFAAVTKVPPAVRQSLTVPLPADAAVQAAAVTNTEKKSFLLLKSELCGVIFLSEQVFFNKYYNRSK